MGSLYSLAGGNYSGPPDELESSISENARTVLTHAFDGFDEKHCIVDMHTHLLGRGNTESDTPTGFVEYGVGLLRLCCVVVICF